MQIFVRNLQGRTRTLSVQPDDPVRTISSLIQASEGVPADEQGLVFAGRQLQGDRPLSDYDISKGATVHLVLRLRGGKGGFGALLRGAGRAALTDNFDACRDLSGKRLRHVNAEKKLRDWAKQSKELKRHLADLKRAKEEEKKAKRLEGTEAELDTVRTAQRTALAGVLAAFEDGLVESGAVQRLKRPADDSSPPKQPATKKARLFDLDSFDIDSDLSESEDDDDWSIDELAGESDQAGPSDADKQQAGKQSEAAADDKMASAAAETPAGLADKVVDGALAEARAPEAARLPAPGDKPPAVLVGDGDDVIAELDLQQYSSAEALQAVGLERLKQELSKHGLKCGGTLKDRAARLFLLTDTPIEKLDKQHFAKPAKK